MAAINASTHCIDYKSTFEHKELESVKLTMYFDDRTKKTKSCKVFTGEHGIEALLFVEQRFRKIAETFKLDEAEWFDHFEEVLQDTAEDDWESLTSDINDKDKNEDCFII